MAPHVHRLSAYASQRLVSLFDMLSRKYVSFFLNLCKMYHFHFKFIPFRADCDLWFWHISLLLIRYNKLADRRDNKLHVAKENSIEGNNFVEDVVYNIYCLGAFVILLINFWRIIFLMNNIISIDSRMNHGNSPYMICNFLD
jgi:hypothetical protein